jgi:acyl-coenzyme A thioesterase PaaI-like protein
MTELSTRKRFGVVGDDQQRAMSGLAFVQGLVDGTLPLNTMAQTLGYDIVEVSKGCVVAAAEPHGGHLNPAGTVHGGLAATLLDSCMGLAIRSMLDKGFAQTTLACSAYHPADRRCEG